MPKTDLSVRKVDPHIYNYTINNPHLCSPSSDILLLVGVCSSVENYKMRDAIRKTWGQIAKQRPDTRLAFMLGSPLDKSIQLKIQAESEQHNDIIQEDFSDTYFNLSVKSVMLLKWVSNFCSKARYVLKIDDDMFINLPRLIIYLNATRNFKHQLFGHLNEKATPNRSLSSRRLPLLAAYHSKFFPNYLSGGAYVMSGDVAHALYLKAIKTPVFRVEDVYVTGILAKRANVRRFDHGNFKVSKPSNACDYKQVITGHGYEAEEMRETWRKLWEECN